MLAATRRTPRAPRPGSVRTPVLPSSVPLWSGERWSAQPSWSEALWWSAELLWWAAPSSAVRSCSQVRSPAAQSGLPAGEEQIASALSRRVASAAPRWIPPSRPEWTASAARCRAAPTGARRRLLHRSRRARHREPPLPGAREVPWPAAMTWLASLTASNPAPRPTPTLRSAGPWPPHPARTSVRRRRVRRRGEAAGQIRGRPRDCPGGVGAAAHIAVTGPGVAGQAESDEVRF